jgi:hypothetical protein
MKSKVLAALFVISSSSLPVTAGAADLYPDYRPRVGSPYEDPRYRGIYGDEAPAPAPRYVERRDLGPPPAAIYPEPRRGYLPPMPPPAHIDQRYWQPERGGNCVPREHIKQVLVQDGWSGFQDLDMRGPFAVLHAYRPDGRLYRLKIDRCSGDLLSTRLVDRREQADASEYDDPPEAPRGSRYDGPTYRY